jgi:hypothetical protein
MQECMSPFRYYADVSIACRQAISVLFLAVLRLPVIVRVALRVEYDVNSRPSCKFPII